MTSHFIPQHRSTSILAAAEQDDRARLARLDRLIPGATPAMQSMKRLIVAMAPGCAPVLITGQSGAGKELVAQALHDLSGRAGPFIAVNCAAIPAELLEGELFGTERGAYTGADRARAGLIEQAQGGTLFLDEIGDMPAALQAKLLRVLETRSLRRLGGGAPVQLEFRLVAATHCDLEGMVAQGRFRQDLFYRLAVFPVEVPPLRDRLADLPLIMTRLLDEQALQDPATPLPEFDASALRALAMHDWPGNVRELKTVILRACLLFPGRPVTARELRENLLHFTSPAADAASGAWPEAPLPGAAGLPGPDRLEEALSQFKGDIDLRAYLRDIEVAFITAALQRTDHCVSRAADRLRLRRTTLIEKLRKYGITATA
jgi:sigma-54 dependent transcriptional regulator, flagellar regulatory protein